MHSFHICMIMNLGKQRYYRLWLNQPMGIKIVETLLPAAHAPDSLSTGSLVVQVWSDYLLNLLWTLGINIIGICAILVWSRLSFALSPRCELSYYVKILKLVIFLAYAFKLMKNPYWYTFNIFMFRLSTLASNYWEFNFLWRSMKLHNHCFFILFGCWYGK